MRISDWSSDVCSSDLPAALRTTRWFADKAAIVQLPSLQSLQLLRAVASRDGPGAGNGMIGFGDPLLEGNAATRGVEGRVRAARSEEHTSELQSLMRISYAVFCLKKKNKKKYTRNS